jgi:hypothetical protein
MKKFWLMQIALPFLAPAGAVALALCLGSGQPPSFSPKKSSAPPVRAMASKGGADIGGGNSVGNELFDDYENENSEPIPLEKVEEYVKPFLRRIESKSPGFAQVLRGAIYGNKEDLLSPSAKKWYLEPKPLSQSGSCVNNTILSVKRVVRACQTKIAVRLDRGFFLSHPDFQAPVILHELLVNLQLSPYRGSISDEGVREASRVLRDPASSPALVQSTLHELNFGLYRTDEQRRQRQALTDKARRLLCLDREKEADELMEKFEAMDYVENNGAFDDEMLRGYELRQQKCPKSGPRTEARMQCAQLERQARAAAYQGTDSSELQNLFWKISECNSKNSVDKDGVRSALLQLNCRMLQLRGARAGANEHIKECEALGFRFSR